MSLPPRLYHDLAHLWPLMSPPADYAAEAGVVRALLREHLGSRRGRVLEFGAGGGHTLYHLIDDVDAVAIDLSPAMLTLCRKLNPGVETVVGDMRTCRLGRTFDAVLIHDAIDYVLTPDDLRQTLDTVAAHLDPGGLALIAPTYVRETFTDKAVEHDHREGEGLELTYFAYVHDPDPSDTTFELVLVYLIREGGGPLRIEHDRHTCGLFGADEWLALLDAAGFDAELHEPSAEMWTLFVARKR